MGREGWEGQGQEVKAEAWVEAKEGRKGDEE